ncbi:MAG: tetratricopeptide repeat protein [Sulfuricella sp.]
MGAKHSQLFWIGIWMFGLLSSTALADPTQDTARAEDAFRAGDLTQTITLLKTAASAGYAPAQARLGEILDVSEFNEEAVSWFRKAANQGNAAGEFGLGRMYALGKGIEKDPKKALYWITLAAEKNYLLAINVLIQSYRKGELGLTVDPQQAQLWEAKARTLEKAAAAGEIKKQTEQGQGK